MTSSAPDPKALTEQRAPESTGPSQDLIEQFAALDAAVGPHTRAVDAEAPTLTVAGVHSGLVSVPDRREASSRYTFEAVFASGGLGQIRRAYDHRLKRYVAAKELQKHRPGHASELRFLREALLTARLEHPSIVPIHDLGEHTTGEAFYCMKLVDGRSLDDLVASSSTLLERLALLPHVLAVADALAYAHEKCIIHRDLKPSNVLVGAFGETLVIDWGLAKDLSAEAEPADDGAPSPSSSASPDHLTRTGEFVGTLPFMPPEQAEGKPLDTRADVYAIGAMLYFVLSGHMPYEKKPALTMLAHLLTSPPPDLGTRASGLPADILAIVRKAMSRSPADRYASAQALAADLRRFQAGRLVSARPYSALDLLQHFVRQYRTAAIWASASLSVILAIAIFSYAQILEQKQEADRQREDAIYQGDAARIAQTRAEQLTHESMITARDLFLESGRKKLFQDQNSQEALVLLNEAYKLDPEYNITKLVLAQASYPADALVDSLPYLAQENLAVRYNPTGTRILLSAPPVVLNAVTGETIAELTLDNEAILAPDFLQENDTIIITFTERGAIAQFDTDTGALRSYTPVAWTNDQAPDLEQVKYHGPVGPGLALLTHDRTIFTADIQTGKIVHSDKAPPYYSYSEHKYDASTRTVIFALNTASPEGMSTSGLFTWGLGSKEPKLMRIVPDIVLFKGFAVGDGKIIFFELNDKTDGYHRAKPSPTVWDLRVNTKYSLLPCRGAANFQAQHIVLSPDHRDLFALDTFRLIRWNIRTRGCEAMNLQLPKNYPGFERHDIHVHSRKHGLFMNGDGSSIDRFAYSNLTYQGSFVAHASPIEQLALQPDAPRMITVPLDGDIRVWNFEVPHFVYQTSFRIGLAPTNTSEQASYQRLRNALREPCSLLAEGSPAVHRKGSVFPEEMLELDGLKLKAEPSRYDDGRVLRLTGLCDVWDASDWRLYHGLYSTSLGLITRPEATIDEGRSLLLTHHREATSKRLPSTIVALPDLTPIDDIQELRAIEILLDLKRGWSAGELRIFYPDLKFPMSDMSYGFDIKGSPDGKYIVSQADSGIVQIHDTTTGSLLAELGAASNSPMDSNTSPLCTMPNFSPTWETFITAQKDGTVDVSDAMTFAHIKTLRGHSKAICGSVFDPTGTRIITYDPFGGAAYLWTADDESEGLRLDNSDTIIARFAPNGEIFATGETNGVIRIWSADGGYQVGEFRGHGSQIERLAFSNDSNLLYSMDRDQIAVEWKIRRESRSPAQIDALIDKAVPYRLTGGRVVLK